MLDVFVLVQNLLYGLKKMVEKYIIHMLTSFYISLGVFSRIKTETAFYIQS